MRNALERYYFAPAPAERLAAMRILVGGYAVVFLLVRGFNLASPARFSAERFAPVGVVSLLSAPLPGFAVIGLVAATLLLGLAFTWGRRFRLMGPLFAAALLWVTTYRNSWGMVFHTENLMVLQVCVLGFVASADTWSWDATRRAKAPRGEVSARYGWPLRLLAIVVVLCYLIAAVAKLRASGLHWLHPDWLRHWIAYDNLRKVALGDIYSPLGAALVRHRWVFTPLAFFAVLLELGAPVALLNRRIAWAWVAGVVGFHWGVLFLMAIAFPYQMALIPFACFFAPEVWIVRTVTATRRWTRRQSRLVVEQTPES